MDLFSQQIPFVEPAIGGVAAPIFLKMVNKFAPDIASQSVAVFGVQYAGAALPIIGGILLKAVADYNYKSEDRIRASLGYKPDIKYSSLKILSEGMIAAGAFILAKNISQQYIVPIIPGLDDLP